MSGGHAMKQQFDSVKVGAGHRRVPGAQSVARAAALLRAVGTTRSQGSTLTQVASEVGLNVPTTRRLLQAMAAEGFLTFDRESKLYRVGPELVALASAGDQMFAERGLLAAAAQEVAVRTSDTTVLMMRCGQSAVCIGRYEGTFHIRVYSLEVGDVRPLGVGSGTLAMLAFLPEAERDMIQAKNAKEYRRYKLTREKVEAMSDATRAAGYALNPGLVLPGVFGIGVPILREDKVVASISVAAIEQRLNKRRRMEVVDTIRNAIKPLKDFDTHR
jgi:DNA-binding IclR family transcriptional regulator